MNAMKTGLFCTYENPNQNTQAAFQAQVAMVQQAEKLGFEEAWVAEHHFSDFHVSPSISVLLAYLAGVTSTIRIGSAAVLLAFHNPIAVAEDIATLDHLSQGRLLFGIAKGGPFPEQNKHFAVPMAESRARTLEALELIDKLLYGTEISFSGQYYQCDRVTIHPQPLQQRIPVYIASSDDQAIGIAAAHSFGLMGGPPFSLAQLKTNLARYRAINPSGSESLVLARFFHVAKTQSEAIAQALPFLQAFSDRMKASTANPQTNTNSRHLQTLPNQLSCFDVEVLLANSIIGDVATCRDRIKHFQDELNLGTLALKPSAFTVQQNQESLSRYAQEVKSYVS